MTRRGLSMLEVLVSLVLLSALALAATGWSHGAVGLAQDTSERSAWNASASAALRLITDDLHGLDASDQPRIEITESTLTVRTRRPALGPVTVRYEVDGTALHATVDGGAQHHMLNHAPPLLGELASAVFAGELDEDETLVAVSIDLVGGPSRETVRLRVPVTEAMR